MLARKRFQILWVIGCCLLGLGSANASVLASLDPTAIIEGRSVQLTLSMEGEDGEPDFAPLQRDFEILSRSQNSQFSFVNGHSSSKKSWVLTLMPRRSGQLMVPAISVGKGRSNPLRLTVSPAGSVPPPSGQSSSQQTQDIMIEATISPNQGRVQQQLIYTVQLFRAVNLGQAQLSEPKVDHAVVVRLGDDRNFEMVRSGKRFVVTERKYAIFPQQRGVLTIAPLRFDGRLVSGGSMFDPFNRLGQVVRRFSNPVRIDVAGVPKAWRGGSWLPASAVSLAQSLSDGPYKVGEPITRKVALRVSGLTAAQLSPILDGVLPDGLKRYPDQPKISDEKGASGVVGVRQEKVAVIPLHGGNFILPGIDVPWWNVATGRVETVSIAPRVIRVEGAVVSPPPPQQTALPTAQPKAEIAEQQPSTSLRWWQGGALLLLLMWLVTLGLWWRDHQRSCKQDPPAAVPMDSDAIALRKQVVDSCRKGDDALLVQSLSAWSHSLRQQGVDVEQRFPQLAAEMTRLHRQRYGGGGEWEHTELLRQFELACEVLDGVELPANLPLPPLY